MSRKQLVLLTSLLLAVVGFVAMTGRPISAHEGHSHGELAQTSDTTTPVPTPAATTVPVDTVFIKPQDTERATQILKLYQDQAEQYRTLEREYRIAKAQFFQLNTLQSLEEAVVATRKVMVSRDDVLISYCELLLANLRETEGIEISLKSKSISDLESQIQALKKHQAAAQETKDREGIDARAEEFSQITASLELRAYTALGLISTGRLQTIYDKSNILYGAIKEHHAENPVSALKQEERERAYREVDATLKEVNADLKTVRDKVETEKIEAESYKSVLIKDLNKAYAGDSLIIDFLHELFVELT